MANDFAKSLAALCNAQKERAKDVVRLTMLDLYGQCVERSPVGNPSLWKGNAGVMAARGAYLEDAHAYNEANPGKRKKGVSRRTVNKKFPLKVGKIYTGGRFKSNWQVGIGTLNTTVDEAINASGRNGLARAQSQLARYELGHTIYIGNNLPYAKKLEFGHSKQAPAGVIRLVLQNTQQALKEAVRQAKAKGKG